MKTLDARLQRLEAQQRAEHGGEAFTSFAYRGERRRLQTDDNGRAVYSWDDVVAALADNRQEGA